MSDLSKNCPRKILGDICTEKKEYMYVAIEKCSELCEFVRIKKRKLAKAAKKKNDMKQPKLYIKNENMSKKIEFIDLGLPSGRLWAKENEEGHFTYDKAKEKFGELLPKPEAFKELWENCQWLWDVKNKGMIVVGPNKNIIFLPVWGYGGSDGFNNRYSYGYYCSSDIRKDIYCPIVLNFNAEAVWPESNFHYSCGLSVRLCREV